MNVRSIVLGLLALALVGGAVLGAIRYGGPIWQGMSDFYLSHEPQFIRDIKNETGRKEAAQCIEAVNPEIYVAELGIVANSDVYVSFIFKKGQTSNTSKILQSISACVLEHIPATQEMRLARLVVVVNPQGELKGLGLVIYLIVAREELEGMRDSESAENYFLMQSMLGNIYVECPACFGGVPTPWSVTEKWDYHSKEATAAYVP